MPLLGFADWNDTVNLPTGAESLFTSHLYGRALSEMMSLTQYMGNRAVAGEYQSAYKEMRVRVEKVAWDGDWYVMYFDQNGHPVGSAQE